MAGGLSAVPSNNAASRFRELVDRLGAIVWEARPGEGPGDARFTFVSEGTEALLGHPAERWTADPGFWLEIVHPDDRARLRDEIRRIVEAGRGSGNVEYRSLRAEGGELWVRAVVQADRDEAGVRLHGVVVDISDRKAAEDRLERVQRLTDALAGMLDARQVAALVASEGRAAVGATAVAVFLRRGDQLELAGYDGYPDQAVQDVCLTPLAADVPAAEATRTGETIVLDAAALAARYPGMGSWRRLAGSGELVAIPLALGAERLGALAVRMPRDRPVDAADRVLLQVLARASAQAVHRAGHVAGQAEVNAVLDAIITTAPEGFALFDTDLRYVRVNDALAAINGVPAAEHVGRTLQEIVPDVPAEGHEGPLRQVLATGRPVLDIEVTGFTGGDPTRPHTWLASYYPVRRADGEIGWLGGFLVDITARKRQEEGSRLLAELGSRLEEVADPHPRAARVAEALVPAAADACTVLLRDETGELVPVVERRADPALELRAELAVPLRTRGRDLGLLRVGSGRPEAFDAREAELLEEVARRAALALDNALLSRSERRARERARHQIRLASVLAEAMTVSDVARAIVDVVVPAVGAEAVTIWQLAEDGAAVELVGAKGFEQASLDGHERISLDERRPVADTVRRGRPLIMPTAADMEAAYPGWGAGYRAAGIAAAAVLPLLSAGRSVGGLWLSASREHAFDEDDLALAGALAGQAAQALERARLFEAERRVSVTLQRSLLPAQLPEVDGAGLAVRYLPAAGLEAGGDFYEALPLSGGGVAVAVGDVVGRGAAAAAAMGQLRSALRAFALAGARPAALLRQLSGFAETVGGAMAATAIVARLQPDSGELRFACAGHPWPLLIHPSGWAEFLTSGRGVPLAVTREPLFEEGTATLEPGATLLLYTDGLTERRDEDMSAVLERLRLAAGAAAGAPLDTLLDAAVAATGVEARPDDVALVAIRRTATAAAPLVRRFAPNLAEVPLARGELREWMAGLGLDRAAAGDLLLAAGEAVANAVEHAGAAAVELRAALLDAAVLELVVADDGAWKEQVMETHRGRGLGLMRALVDEVALERGDAGTTVRLRRRVAAAPPPAGVSAPLAAASVPADGGCTVTVRDGVATVQGDLDLSCAARIGEQLRAAAPHTIDLSAVAYLDSAGARMLLELASGRPGRLAVIAPPGAVPRRALELSGLAGLLDISEA
jgi:PAS domain S-box-containing protein